MCFMLLNCVQEIDIICSSFCQLQRNPIMMSLGCNCYHRHVANMLGNLICDLWPCSFCWNVHFKYLERVHFKHLKELIRMLSSANAFFFRSLPV